MVLNGVRYKFYKFIAQKLLNMKVSEEETRKLPFAESGKMFREAFPPSARYGVGFVTSPYMQWVWKVWGVQPWEKYGELRRLYREVPYVNASVNVSVNFILASGFNIVGGREEVRDYLIDKFDEFNLKQILRPAVLDMFVLGNAYIEKCYEKYPEETEYEREIKNRGFSLIADSEREIQLAREFNNYPEKLLGDIIALKVLDPQYIRVRSDAYGNIIGAIQLVTVPPIVFRTYQLIMFKYILHSTLHECLYGLSPLMPLLGVQEKIDKFEEDMSTIIHVYSKPMLIVKAGTPEKPASVREIEELANAFKERRPDSDIIIRGHHDVKPIQSLGPMGSQIEWYLNYLREQRDAVLGVPRLFLGRLEGVNRATAEILLTEYLGRLSAIRENIAEQLYDELIKPLVYYKFGEQEEIPEIIWNPIIPPQLKDQIEKVVSLKQAGIITVNEAREELGYEEKIEELEEESKELEKISKILEEESKKKEIEGFESIEEFKKEAKRKRRR